MKATPSIVALALGFLTLGPLCAGPAQAALSGDTASVHDDEIELRGTVTAVAHFAGFERRTLSTDTGLVINEFLTPAGTVFALSWSGPVLPDLRALLGRHYSTYVAALGQFAQPGLKRSLRISTADFVMESAGHLRAFVGHAYVPSLLPGGVPLRDLPW
ncbi:MAG TPA: DUF2844 domain-containing protein [Steroidobacteraceae bacterium]